MPLAQGTRSTDGVVIDYIIVYMFAEAATQKAAHGGWRGLIYDISQASFRIRSIALKCTNKLRLVHSSRKRDTVSISAYPHDGIGPGVRSSAFPKWLIYAVSNVFTGNHLHSTS